MHRRLLDVVLSAILILFYVLLLAVAVRSLVQTGHLYLLVLATQEALIIAMIVTRRQAHTVSQSPQAWIVAFVGTFAPLLFRSGVSVLPSLGFALQVAGTALSVAGIMSLGRSFGLVAANRGVRTSGLYRWTRHPLYGCYLISYVGFMLSNLSIANGLVFVLWLVCLHARALAEERELLQDPAYAAYCAAVPYRYVPRLI